MKNVPVMTAKVRGTEDKMRIRFCLQSFTAKMQDAIDRFFELNDSFCWVPGSHPRSAPILAGLPPFGAK
jgi:hypothetical protein